MSRGHDRERAVRKLLEAEGWFVTRAAGSLGNADLIALRARRYELEPGVSAYTLDACEARMVEVKSSAGGPFEHFRPADRRKMSEAAALAGAQAWLCWWPVRKPPKWYSEDQWPK